MIRSVLSLEQRSWLIGELDAWCTQGILTSDQVSRILDLYESPKDIAERHRNTAVFVLMALAGALMTLGVVLFLAFNWEDMPTPVKLAAIFGTIGGTHLAGFYLRFRRDAKVGSELLFFLGCLFYGAGMALLAHMFHLGAHPPDGLWWWAVGVLPFALCLDTLLLHILYAGLLAIWVGLEVIGYPHLGGWFFFRWHWLPNGAYSLPLLALPGMIWAYRKNSPITLGLYAPLLAWWLLIQPVAWRMDDINPVFLVGTVGGLFLIVGESHKLGSPFARVYRTWGILLTAGVLILLSFYDFNDKVFPRVDFLPAMVLTLGILVATAATVALGVYLQRREAGPANPFVDHLQQFAVRQWLPLSVPILMAFMASWQALFARFDTHGIAAVMPTVLANVAIIAASLWLIRVGLREDRGLPFAAGVAFFLLWAVIRYADLFGDFGGLLGASLMFLLCGAALFGVALYWRKRKEATHAP